jgi:hypothetical protein
MELTILMAMVSPVKSFHFALQLVFADKEPRAEVFSEGSEKWNQRTCPTSTTKA